MNSRSDDSGSCSSTAPQADRRTMTGTTTLTIGEVIDRLKACFREVVLPPGDPCEVAKSMPTENGKQCTEVQQFLSFFAGSKRGFCRVASTAGARRYMARTEARPERSPREAYAEE